MSKCLVIPAVLCFFSIGQAQDVEIDSANPGADDDTSRILDTLHLPEAPGDTVDISDTALSFEERYEEFQRTRERRPILSYSDTLATYLLSSRLNYRRPVDQSFYHDAGGYFRSDPSFFVLEHQVTPMRSTAQPFALAGGRLDVLAAGHHLRPFEHIPEPDGLIDLNDLPTALDDAVYVLPGPVGLIFGGEQIVAALLTRPREAASRSSEARLLADKGSFGYSYVRAGYSQRFADGRTYDLLIGYREADGPALARGDDAYHYQGDLYFPVAPGAALRFWGHLYNRDGNFIVRPEGGGATLLRERSDRSWRLSCELYNTDHSARWELAYRRDRYDSDFKGAYAVKLNVTEHIATARREWIVGRNFLQAEVHAGYREYDDERQSADRSGAGVLLRMMRLVDGARWAMVAGVRQVETFGARPWGAAVFLWETRNFFLMMSAGYVEHAPSLHEMFLSFRTSPLYGARRPAYAEQGHRALEREHQVVGSIVAELGPPSSKVQLCLTGGKILEGIDWRPAAETLNGSSQILFSPVNEDVDFLNIRLQPSVELMNILSISTGGAYHYVRYGSFDHRAYSPKYQLFSSAELHVYWPQRLVHLYAFGEIVYTGAYDGYEKVGLGQEPIANAKLSLGLRDFRFNLVFQNILARVYQAREYSTFPGRYTYYGIEWTFID